MISQHPRFRSLYRAQCDKSPLRVKHNAQKCHANVTWVLESHRNVTFSAETRPFKSLSIVDMNTETTNSMLVRVSRFLSDRYAHRAQPGYLTELLAFGMIVFIAAWPIILAVHAMAVAPR
jgi:hypothetical protein